MYFVKTLLFIYVVLLKNTLKNGIESIILITVGIEPTYIEPESNALSARLNNRSKIQFDY